MPIYEYQCRACTKTCELLVRTSTTPQCPHCGSQKLDKLMSSFSQGSPPLSSTFVPPGTRGHPDN